MRTFILALLIALLAACGGGGGSAQAPIVAPQPPVNSPPVISGSPALQVTEGESYSFTPVASDPDGDALTFSISGQPTWASFDAATGELSGTPGAAHIGTALGVTISVSDGSLSASLAPFDLEVVQIQLGSATVSWDIPTTNADGSNLTDLAGFLVHYGQASQNYTRSAMVDDETINSVTIDDLEGGTWYFMVTALDESGNESAPSPEVSKLVNP